LSGTDERGRATEFALVGNPLAALPETLNDVRVEVDAGRIRLISVSSGIGFDVAAASVHIHRDLRDALRLAIPPRLAPLGRRLLWSLLLTVARSAPGRALLLRIGSRTRARS
jgi:hypothetical protein